MTIVEIKQPLLCKHTPHTEHTTQLTKKHNINEFDKMTIIIFKVMIVKKDDKMVFVHL